MKSIRNVLYILIFIGALLLLKYFFFPSEKNEPSKASSASQKDGKPASPSVLVSIFVVKPQTLDNNLFATGTILANEEVDLKPEVSGKVMGIYFNEGEPVTGGKLLVKLNDEDLQAQYKKVKAEIDLAEEKLSRYNKLLKINGISQEEYDMATNQLQSLKADAEVLQVQINRCRIVAPFTGIIGLRNISVGSYITPLQIVARIQQLNPVKIDFSIPERYAGQIKKGSKIQFTTDGSDTKYEGTVYAFEPGINSESRSLNIRAKAANAGNKLFPGSFAKIEFILNKNENAIMIPTQAIVPVLKGQQVYVSDQGIAKVVPIEIGLRNEKMVQVVSGLSEGDSVIVTGVMGLRPGSSLKIIK